MAMSSEFNHELNPIAIVVLSYMQMIKYFLFFHYFIEVKTVSLALNSLRCLYVLRIRTRWEKGRREKTGKNLSPWNEFALN